MSELTELKTELLALTNNVRMCGSGLEMFSEHLY